MADILTSRERFAQVMQYGQPDRVPYFEEGIRDGVIAVWRQQGLSGRRELERHFPSDRRERLELDLEPIPEIVNWPSSHRDLKAFKNYFDPYATQRLPSGWKKRVKHWKHRDHVLMLYVHRGFFLSMGVEDWSRFYQVVTQLTDQSDLVHGMMTIQGEFAANLCDQILKQVDIDVAIFSEPIGGNEGPLMSPKMYEDIVLTSYQPVMDVLHRHQVKNIFFQTFANARILIPSIIKKGFNGLWACEVNIEAMEYASLRKEYGQDLKLIGGIDLDTLRCSKKAIRTEIETKVPPLLNQGGYIPLADGRVREDVSFENYCYYREVLKGIIEQ